MTHTLHSIVVGTDGSDGARRAVAWATAQNERGHLTLVHGFSPTAELFAAAAQVDLDPVRAEHGRLLETEWAEPARRSPDRDVDTALIDDNPASALLNLAHRSGADTIVIGHQGLSRWSQHHIGSVASRLLHQSDLPLIITNDSTQAVPLSGTIVVGVELPTRPGPELAWALDLARDRGLEVRVASIVEPVPYVADTYVVDMASIHDEVVVQMDALVDRRRTAAPTLQLSGEVRDGMAPSSLATLAAEVDASLIVVGSHHRGAIAGFATGSVTRSLPPLAGCPVAAIPTTK